MRYEQVLHTDWYVSASAADVALAAKNPGFQRADLEYADDPENHPRKIDLPGGPQYGKRPLGTASPEGHRWPSPFLSYARQFDVPVEYAGQRVFLDLDKACYHTTVFINGKLIEHYVGGQEPHRIDITDSVTPGEAATLLITVGDSGVSGHRVFDAYNYTGTRLPTCKEIENNLVHPVRYGGAGRMLGHVGIVALPPLRTEWVFANPKVARGELEYAVELVNAGDASQLVRVHSEAVGAKTLVDQEVTVPAHSSLRIQECIAWPDAQLWDTDSPHLYDLRTTLTVGGEIVDEHTDYFGFREFTINGHNYYLNGKKIHLLASSGHIGDLQNAMSLEEKIKFFRDWKELGNVNHVRLHARPHHKSWVEAADRAGMLIATETALWTTGYWSFDWVGSEEACYLNVRNHFLEGLVYRDRNSPSVIIWSLSNEMSPITPMDLEIPKMAAMTRVFERIIAETEALDDSRVIQMSSAMDFVGRLKMYNLHYPKSWSGFPDYPRTAYWLDEGFLFPWYGPAKAVMPSWSWRRDKPLYFGEFICIYGPTPDSQSTMIGDSAFEQPDNGTMLVNAKLWPMEMRAYRRQDVSAFCAWAAVFNDDYTDVPKHLERPDMAAHTHALRPLAVLDHSYRTEFFGGDDIEVALSLHNDTRHERELTVLCELLHGEEVIWSESMVSARYGPAENKSWTSRARAPRPETGIILEYRVTLTSDGEVVDAWSKRIGVLPRQGEPLPEGCAFYDPDGILANLCAERGLTGGTFLSHASELDALENFHALWLNFEEARVNRDTWSAIRDRVYRFVSEGGCVVLDKPCFDLAELPVPVADMQGFAAGDRLEITYAYNQAPQHPIMRGLSDDDFALWGNDYYVAHRTLEMPQEGNVVQLLGAGIDRQGITGSPLLEMRHGLGSFLVSTLELFSKMPEAPVVGDIVRRMAQFKPEGRSATVGVSASPSSLQRYAEVGLFGGASASDALAADIALIDGETLTDSSMSDVKNALNSGRTVYLHDLGADASRQVLTALELPGVVASYEDRKPDRLSHDTIRHVHPLTDGISNNAFYWVVDKSKLAMWNAASLHPRPAGALIAVDDSDSSWQLTRQGAVVAYAVGDGLLVIDNLRWQIDELDEPERVRRYLATLLTNLGVPLGRGREGQNSEDFEGEAEKRERGHF